MGKTRHSFEEVTDDIGFVVGVSEERECSWAQRGSYRVKEKTESNL